MLVNLILNFITSKLIKKYNNDSANSIAWQIVQAITSKSKAELIAKKDIDDKYYLEIQDILNKHLEEDIPLQYLLGYVEFLGLKIKVRAPVLIPRPETEEWCFNLIEELKFYYSNALRNKNPNLKILDLCTGSGCIALSLAKAMPEAQIDAIDIEDYAIELAEENAKINNIKNVNFLLGNLFEPIKNSNALLNKNYYDIIVSNPPYISSQEWKNLQPEVKLWESKTALVAKNKGLDIINKIINKSYLYLNKNSIGFLLIEIGYNQKEQVSSLLSNSKYKKSAVIKDMFGNYRLARGWL